MVAVFNTVLQMSRNAAIVIAVVLIIRLLLRKAPKRFSYLLWSVVGFRLCCPVSFSLSFSVFALTHPQAPKLANGGGDIVLTAYENKGGASALESLLGTGGGANIQTAAPTDRISVFNTVVMIIWFIGMTAVLGYAFFSYFRVRRMMNSAIRLEKNVYLSDRVDSPFTLGFIRPKIYIPFGPDDLMRDQVLAHERCHIRRLDHIVKPLSFILLAVHWFNPLCWMAFRLMSLDMEMSCDENVLIQKGNETMKKNYSRALLFFASNRRFPVPSPIAFSESGGNAKKRIKHVLDFKKPKLYVNIICCLLCVFVLAACGANASVPKWQEIRTESFGDVPYNFVFVSNGDGSCYISEIRVDKDHNGTITMVIPEIAPNGDKVTEIRSCGFDGDDAHRNLPVFLTEDDFYGIVKTLEDKNDGDTRDAKIFAAFYQAKNDKNGKYLQLEPLLTSEERLRISEILFRYGYDADDCYKFTSAFLSGMSGSEKDLLTREAFKYLYFDGGRITEICFPASVVKIGYGSFSGCSNLTRVSGLGDSCVIENPNKDENAGLNAELIAAIGNK